MEALDFFSSSIIVGGAAIALYAVVRSSIQFFNQDIVLTNKKNGKSITLGKHPERNQSRELLEFFN